MPRRPSSVAALAVVLTLAAARLAAAQPVTLGSPLTETPNISLDCSAEPMIADTSGNFGLFPSGVPDCTWRQSGVYGLLNDPRASSVPGDGRIVSISVRSGPNPAPLRFSIFRQLASPGFEGGFGQCCFFVAETPPVQPAPNTVTTFPVNLPVVRNTLDGLFAVDLLGVSAASGTGTLPLHSTGRNNSFQLTEFGSVNAGFFYPRMGAIPNDAGGGRREQGIPGIEVLVNFTWVPAGAGGGGGGGAGGAGGAALRGQNGTVTGNRALIDLVCQGNAACRGVLELLNPAARAAVSAGRAAGGARFGKQRYEIAAGANATVGVKLNKKARRLVRRLGALAVTVRLTPEGGAPVTGDMLLTR